MLPPAFFSGATKPDCSVYWTTGTSAAITLMCWQPSFSIRIASVAVVTELDVKGDDRGVLSSAVLFGIGPISGMPAAVTIGTSVSPNADESPTSASALSWTASRAQASLAFCPVPSSQLITLTGRPLMPPAALIAFTAASVATGISGSVASGPERMLIENRMIGLPVAAWLPAPRPAPAAEEEPPPQALVASASAAAPHRAAMPGLTRRSFIAPPSVWVHHDVRRSGPEGGRGQG